MNRHARRKLWKLTSTREDRLFVRHVKWLLNTGQVSVEDVMRALETGRG